MFSKTPNLQAECTYRRLPTCISDLPVSEPKLYFLMPFLMVVDLGLAITRKTQVEGD
jgi:hypothetical protein